MFWKTLAAFPKLPRNKLTAQTLPRRPFPAQTLPQSFCKRTTFPTLPHRLLTAQTLPQIPNTAQTLPQIPITAQTLPYVFCKWFPIQTLPWVFLRRGSIPNATAVSLLQYFVRVPDSRYRVNPRWWLHWFKVLNPIGASAAQQRFHRAVKAFSSRGEGFRNRAAVALMPYQVFLFLLGFPSLLQYMHNT